MPILYSYLLSEMTAPFLASLLIMTGVLFLGQLLQTFNLVFALGIGWADFIRLTLYLMPKLMMFSMPLASMLGVVLAFNRLAMDHEFLALRAAGVKLRQIVTPVAIFALTVTCIAGYSTIVLMPKGLINMEFLMLKLAREKIDRSIKEGTFSDSLAGIVAYVERIDPASGEWQEVYLYDGRNQDQPMTITAKAAHLTADYASLLLGLHLTNGTIDFIDSQISRHIDFERYSINLPVTLPKTGADKGPNPREMSQAALRIAAGKGGARSERNMMIEYHQRITLAAGCFILTLLGLTFAARSRPGVRSLAIPAGLFFFLLYYVLFSFTETVAENWTIPIPLPLILWAPNLLFSTLTSVCVLRMDKDTLIP
ncbi:MAG: LptF/LptG family permease, partial [Desulfobulbaceae bacterium]|nr:LptF/LptG family permease [Desulfobulbaceae bacterium]